MPVRTLDKTPVIKIQVLIRDKTLAPLNAQEQRQNVRGLRYMFVLTNFGKSKAPVPMCVIMGPVPAFVSPKKKIAQVLPLEPVARPVNGSTAQNAPLCAQTAIALVFAHPKLTDATG